MFIGHNEFAVPRLSDHLSLLHDHFPSDDRMGYFPFYLSVVISVQLTLRIDLFGVDRPLSIHVTNCKIGIRVGIIGAAQKTQRELTVSASSAALWGDFYFGKEDL